jgi:hypothetical protein
MNLNLITGLLHGLGHTQLGAHLDPAVSKSIRMAQVGFTILVHGSSGHGRDRVTGCVTPPAPMLTPLPCER